jgi:nitrite reductase (NO-forming)
VLLVASVAAEGMAQTSSATVATLTQAPLVPPSVGQRQPARVLVELEAQELTGQLADGVGYVFWTFGGKVPGNFIRVREGDVVDFRLSNRLNSQMPHNIDLHAVTGPGGGAAASFVARGQAATFEFQARKPGLYVYHCATAPVGMHIANGMYGLILVEPAGGLRRVDREYYVMQGEFYTDGAFGEQGLRQFSMEEALAETPDYVVFNGAVGSLTGEAAITARVGETLRLYVGNGGPNLTSAFHVTGEIFDRVFPDGSGTPLTNAQTVLIPPGGTAIVEFDVEVPGTYVLADHTVFRAFNRGAIGNLRVEGPENLAVYSGRVAENVYLLEGAAIQEMPIGDDSATSVMTLEERIESGRRIFAQTCQACHQADGSGVPGSFPPLAGSDFLNNNPRATISIVLNGLSGAITVNGETYNAVMPALRLSDENIADVLTYVYSQWGNAGHVITVQDVSQVRHCPWCAEDVRLRGQ